MIGKIIVKKALDFVVARVRKALVDKVLKDIIDDHEELRERVEKLERNQHKKKSRSFF